MKKILFTFICFSQILFSQPDTLWTKTIWNNNSQGFSIIETLDGGFAIVGEESSNDEGDILLIKTDSEGNNEWVRIWEGSNYESGRSIIQTCDSGFAVLADSAYSSSGSDVILLKLDTNGDEEWRKKYSLNNFDYGRDIKQTSDGGFVFTGQSGNRAWIVKTDSLGITDWSQVFGGYGNSSWGSDIELFQNSYIISGGYQEPGTSYDLMFASYSISGTLENLTTYGDVASDYSNAAIIYDGEYFMTGRTMSYGNGMGDMWLVRSDLEGNISGHNTFGGSNWDYGVEIMVHSNGGFVLFGTTESFGSGEQDFWVLRTDINGNELWNKTVGTSLPERARDGLVASDSGFVILGHKSVGFTDNIWLVKLEPEIFGCTDPEAFNYNPDANLDDGNCLFEPHFTPIWEDIPINPMGFYISSATINGIDLMEFDEIAIFDGYFCVGNAQLESEIFPDLQIFASQDNPNTEEQDGFLNGSDIHYKFWDASEQLEVINVNPIVLGGDDVFTPLGYSEVELFFDTILGCTDINSINYNPEATVDDGSCLDYIFGCTNPEACNFDLEANTDDNSCLTNDCDGVCGGSAYIDDCDVCDEDTSNDNDCFGCVDLWALNYDPNSTISDDSCEYPIIGDISMDGFINVNDIVLLVGVVLDGEYYIEYMDFNQDTYLNIIDIVILVDIILNPEYFGCTDPLAINFLSTAIYSDGFCEYSCIDIDGNIYDTITIGDQIWMAENLRVTHYNNGDEIPTGFTDSEWSNLGETETDGLAVYNDDPSNVETYGNLYNWYAVDDSRVVCPEGWHVPTDDEWMELEMFLGMSYDEAHDYGWRGTNQGSQLAGNSDLWISGDLEDDSAFGSSGFDALPAGSRIYNSGYYFNMGDQSYFWSSTANGNIHAWYRSINHNSLAEYRGYYDMTNGFSVRCLRD
jgi:uncharacterized protein (TIGR02145 family)